MKHIVINPQELQEWKATERVQYASEFDDSRRSIVRLWCHLDGSYSVQLGKTNIYEGRSVDDAIRSFQTRQIVSKPDYGDIPEI